MERKHQSGERLYQKINISETKVPAYFKTRQNKQAITYCTMEQDQFKSSRGYHLKRPKSKEEWELVETFHTNFELRDEMIQEFAMQIYTSLIKSVEAEQQEQGMLKNIITKILDNIQLKIQNIHLRLENYENFNNKFSLGVTLKEITVQTTNNQWQKEFFDRTKDSNQEKPIFKILNIVKFGIYWKTNEDMFIARDYDNEEDRLRIMKTMYQEDEDIIQDLKDYYLLQPIQLSTRLKQVTQQQLLEKEAEYQISLDIDEFSIFLQKTQYDNIVNIIELFNDYGRFQEIYQQTRKYKFLRPMVKNAKEAPAEWLKFSYKCIKREIIQKKSKKNQFLVPENLKKELKKKFAKSLEIRLKEVIKASSITNKIQYPFDEYEDLLFQENESKIYEYTVLAIDFDELKLWSEEVGQYLAKEHKRFEELNKNSSKGGILSYIPFSSSWLRYGGTTETSNQEESKEDKNIMYQNRPVANSESDEDEFYDALDDQTPNENQQMEQTFSPQPKKSSILREDELIQIRDSLINNFQFTSNRRISIDEQRVLDIIQSNTQLNEQQYQKYRQELKNKAIPFVQAEFRLKCFSISLVDNKAKQEGIELYTHDFTIEFKKFDEANSLNINAFELTSYNKEFGINQLIKIERQIYKTAIVQRVDAIDQPNANQQFRQNDQNYQAVVKIIKGNFNSGLNQKYIVSDNLDFDILIQFQPVKIVYQVIAINKLVQFFKVDNFKDELKLQAMEKLESIKQSVNLTDVLKNKKKNRLRIDIASPILIIPFKKNNDINSECWIFNMGNLSVQNLSSDNTGPNQLSLKNYLNYQIEVSEIMMRYTKSYKVWLSDPAFSISVLKEFKLSLILSLKKDIDQSDRIFQLKPDVMLQGSISNLNLFFTPHIYNQFLNIDKLLNSASSERQYDEKQQMINEKNQVIKMASKMGIVKKKGTTIKFWYQNYAVLSGGYIYFYEKTHDNYPSEYFYIKGCVIQRDVENQINHTLLLKNSYGEQCCIALNSTKNQNEWENAIKEKSFELQKIVQQQNQQIDLQNEQNSLKPKIDLDKILMQFDFEIPQIQIELLAEKKQSKFQEFDHENDDVLDTDYLNSMAYNDEDDDIGIFTSQKINLQNLDKKSKSDNPFQKSDEGDQDEKKWSIVLTLDNIKFRQVKRQFDSNMKIILTSMNIKDGNNPRFSDIINSQLNDNNKALIEIIVKRQEKDSPLYDNEDFVIDIMIGNLLVNWHPKSINRMIKFFRYIKLPSEVQVQERDKILKLNALQQSVSLIPSNEDSNTFQQVHSHQYKNFESFQQQSNKGQGLVQNCQTIPSKLIRVNAKLELLKIVFIHPINISYPISTFKLGNFEIDYSMHYDHDYYKGQIGDFRVFDNTNFPLTLDPTRSYFQDQEYPNHEILGPRHDNDKQFILQFECTLFSNPTEKICPHQQEQYDKNIILHINPIKLNYMQELILRINDYFFSQFLGALSESNPYQSIIDELQCIESPRSRSPQAREVKRESQLSFKSLDSFARQEEKQERPFSFINLEFDKTGSLKEAHQKVGESPESRKWKNFDLQQQTFCSYIQLTIDRPLIVLKDRPYLNGNLEIDLGKISILSQTEPVIGRWKSIEAKQVWVTKFIIEMKDMGITFDNSKFEVAPSFDMKVIFEKLNYSPLLENNYTSKDIDFVELDISYKISITFSPVIMRLKQDIYTYIMRCVDLNFNYTDELTKYFQLTIWNDGSDTQKYIKQEKEIVRIFKNKEVFKMKVYLNFPSLALQLLNKNDEFLSEFVLWNANIDFLKYLDYRKSIHLQSHTLFILHNEQSQNGQKMKQVVVAPVASKNLICTDEEFYNFEISSSVSKMSPNKKMKAISKMNKKNFTVAIHLESDGDKLIQTKIEKLKIFIKPHVFLMIFELFVYGMPQYKDDSRDKPNFYDSDYGNAPRMEVCCQILQSLLCFENDEKYQKTIACQGNTSFTYIREKLNQIKAKLVERPQFQEDSPFHQGRSSMGGSAKSSRRGSMSQANTTNVVDQSATIKIMQVSISDLCPFFCTPQDLEGKNFKSVKKREMMSPFTLFYNRSDIIELTKLNERLYVQSPDRLVFQNYSKTEANLERTLLKISFNDLQILKGISDHLGHMLDQEYIRLVRESNPQIEMDEHLDQDYNMYSDMGILSKRQNKQMSKISEESEEKKRYSKDEEELYQDESSSDDEDQDDTFFKQRNKLPKNMGNQRKQNRAEDFTESVRRTSRAFSMIQRRYTIRQTELQAVQESIEKVGQDQKYSIQERFRQVQKEIIDEEDDCDDIDEGIITINTKVLGQEDEAYNASKKLMNRFDPTNLTKANCTFLSQIKEDRGVDQFQVVSYGLKILVINDNQQNFFPVLGISISEFHYQSDQNETQRIGSTQFSSALNYYNPEAGEWEPFVETFRVHIAMTEESVNQKRMLQCEFPTQLSVNVTEKLVKNLSDTYKSWQNQEQLQKSVTQSAAQLFLNSDRGGTLRLQNQTSNKYPFDDIDEEEELEQSKKEEDIVTPYSVSNQTHVKLLVKRLNPDNDRDSNEKKSKQKHKHQFSGLQVRGGVGSSQHKLNRVYVINPDETIDYAVDYELQVKQQMNLYNSHQFSGQQGEYIKILFEDVGALSGGVSTGMNIPLNSVNLNQVGCKKHYVKDDDKRNLQEFFVYGVTQVNMKKVLTIRTQYLFVNQTFFNYEIHIRFANSSINRTLMPGDKMPIPDTYNKCKFQIRISYQQFHQDEEQDDSPKVRRHKKDSVYSKVGESINDDSIMIEEIINRKGDVPDFRSISKNWSEMLMIKALKTKLPINRATFLQHGKTYTIIKKETSQFPDAFDITLRPPLLVKNCLPIPIMIEYQDSNNEIDKLDLQKQEEKHVFVFNLQQPVMLKIFLEGFTETLITLDCQIARDLDIRAPLFDSQGRSLDIYVATSTKVAGKKAIFYVKNLVINNTQQELTFYYSQPNEKQIRSKIYKDIVAGTSQQRNLNITQKKFYMLSDRKEIFATIEGSNDVCNPINIHNPGCKDKFILTKDDQLYEYSYSTGIFLSSNFLQSYLFLANDDCVYTKITSISPLYVFVNKTQSVLIVAQKDAKQIPFIIPTNERVPFHWADKKKDQQVCLKLYNNNNLLNKKEQIEYDWSCGFIISELGTLSVQNRQKQKENSVTLQYRKFKTTKQNIKYLKIDKRLHNNTIFIIVEEENIAQPSYKIENFSKNFALRYSQVDVETNADLLNVNESTPYAWTEYLANHELEFDLFYGDLNLDKSFYIQNIRLRFQLDELNFKQVFRIPVGYQEEIPLYVCTFTNGYTKVIRFSDVDNTHVTATNQEDRGEEEDENCTQMAMYEVYLKQLNLSVIADNAELFVLYLQGIYGKVSDTEKDTKTEFKIGYIQIDNQCENEPIYPVILKPKYIKCTQSMNELDDDSSNSARYNIYRQQGILDLYVDYRKNIPHVAYFDMIEYLVQTMEIKLEFSNILMISKFVSKVGQMLNKNLTFMHQIFEDDENVQPEEEPDFFKINEYSPNGQYTLRHKLHEEIKEEESEETPMMMKTGKNRFNSNISQDFTEKLIDEISHETEEQKEDIKVNFNAIHDAKVKRDRFRRGFSSDNADFQSKSLKRRTVASSLGLSRKPSEKDNNKNYSYKKEETQLSGSIKKNKSLQQELILERIRTQDQQKLRMNTKIHNDNWKSEEFDSSIKRIYIKEYKASPFEFVVSVMNKATFEMEDSDIFKTVSSLGLVINSIDEAPIKLNALVLRNVFGNYNDVVAQMRNHHTERLKWNILKFIGASNLLGNPMNFVNALGTGVQDFFYQPRQGFVKGPLQGGIGIIKGTGSLVKNTFIGTIGSASKMVSSVSKGLLVLSNDKEYIYKRDVDNIKQKPKNVIQGLNLGLKSAFASVGSGITGVVTQPYQETKKGGFVGFLKGTAQGVTGLVVKPLSGTLDFFSITTEGIKNTSKNDEELAQDKRLRLPRPFYETEQIIREYDSFHAFWINQVPQLKKEISSQYFFEACILECTDTSWSILFLTLNHLSMIIAEQKGQQKKGQLPFQIKWVYDTKSIKYVDIVEESNLTVGFDDANLSLPMGDQFQAEKVRSKIEKIMKQFK